MNIGLKIDRYSNRSVAVRLFLTCWLVYCLHFATNMVREIYPALTLGDHLSFDVSEYLGLHSDIFQVPGRGAYINNNPGASILGAVPYRLSKPLIDWVTGKVLASRQVTSQPPEYDSIYPLAREFYQKAYARGLDVKFGMAAGVMQTMLMAPLSAASVVVMFYLLLACTKSKVKALVLSILYAFATPVFFRTGQLNHNLLQSHFALFSFALLWQPWQELRNIRKSAYFLVGLFAGWTVVLDYSGIILLGAIGLYLLLRLQENGSIMKSKQELMLFTTGAVLSLSVLVGYQWLAFGHPLYPAQHYMPSTLYSGFGYQGMDWPKLDLLIANFINPRYGLLISAPIFILAAYPPGWYNPRVRIIGRKETIFVLVLFMGMFLFTAANQFSRMQFNSGIRHILPVVPFLFFIVSGVLLAMPRWLAVPVGVLSLFWSWCLAMYRDVEQGRGVVEALLYVLRHGVVLPWLTTINLLHLKPDWLSAWLVLGLACAAIAIIWLVRLPDKNKRQTL
jgi:hypothetical protein